MLIYDKKVVKTFGIKGIIRILKGDSKGHGHCFVHPCLVTRLSNCVSDLTAFLKFPLEVMSKNIFASFIHRFDTELQVQNRLLLSWVEHEFKCFVALYLYGWLFITDHYKSAAIHS